MCLWLTLGTPLSLATPLHLSVSPSLFSFSSVSFSIPPPVSRLSLFFLSTYLPTYLPTCPTYPTYLYLSHCARVRGVFVCAGWFAIIIVSFLVLGFVLGVIFGFRLGRTNAVKVNGVTCTTLRSINNLTLVTPTAGAANFWFRCTQISATSCSSGHCCCVYVVAQPTCHASCMCLFSFTMHSQILLVYNSETMRD